MSRSSVGGVERNRPPRGTTRRRGSQSKYPMAPRPVGVRLKAVQLHLEEGIPLEVISAELKVTRETLRKWVKRYREEGESGLRNRSTRPDTPKSRLPAAVHQAMVDVKRAHPSFGVRKIAQWLKRTLFLPGSAETVRQTLHRRQAMPDPPRKKIRRNPPKPRFFERSTPNQMWQSDIFSFRVNGQAIYLIGFIDDYSRYLTGLGVFRSQTAENVLEVYRRAVGDYGLPKEMLTDNGKQYAAWRGKSRFQMELAKDRIHHIRSAPHHPMTLGKIERFWKTIWEEFLERARFESFENAQERVGYWLKYYNHQRPHQGIEGMCPADRFFSIQKEVREAVERGLEANLQELALRGRPQAPFYMVGRVGQQNVVLQAERGQVRILVDGQETQGGRDGDGREGEAGTAESQCAGEMPGGPGVMDGASAALGDLQGVEHSAEPVEQLAGTGDGRYVTGVGAEESSTGMRTDAVGPYGTDAGTQGGPAQQPDYPAEPESQGAGAAGGGGGLTTAGRREDGHGGADDAGHSAAVGRQPDGSRGGPAVGDIAQELLPMGTACVVGDATGVDAGTGGTSGVDVRPGTGADGGPEPAVAKAGGVAGATAAGAGDPEGG